MSPPRALPSPYNFPEFGKKRPCKARRDGAGRPCSRAHQSAAEAGAAGLLHLHCLFALGKHEVGKGRVRHTPRGKFRSGSLEKWIGDQRTLKKPRPAAAPGTPIPRRAPHSPLSLARAAEPGSRASRCCRMPSWKRDGASRLQPASNGGRGAGRAERLLSSVRVDAPGVPGNFARARGWRGGGPPRPARQHALPVHLQVPMGARPPPARLQSAPQRASGQGRRSAEAWLGTWSPWGGQLPEAT